MSHIMRVFKVNKEELLAATAALVVFILLNALMVHYHYDLFTRHLKGGYWSLFYKHFTVSGFDCYTYVVISKWRMMFSLYRHPLLAVMMYPLFLLNGLLTDFTGVNCAIFIVAAVLLACDFYSFVFSYRVFRSVMSLGRTDSVLLSSLFFSFATIMLTTFVPDHFGFSLPLLSLTLYWAGMRLRQGRRVGALTTALLFFVSSGITLTNGAKVLMAALCANGRRFFRPRWLLCAAVAPAVLLLSSYVLQDRTLMEDERRYMHKMMAANAAKKDSVSIRKLERQKQVEAMQHEGQIIDSEYFAFTDTRVPKVRTITENLFGESIQLHQEHLLEDVNGSRPLFVPYSNVFNYIVEIVIVLLFAAGLWKGRRDRFLWISASWFLMDMLLHIVLSFGITEVYIMGAHWMISIPVAIGFLLASCEERHRTLLRYVLAFLCVYLLVYNGMLVCRYLI